MSDFKNKLKSNEISICSMPWVELHITTTRDIKNCCAQVGEYAKLGARNFNLKEQFNNPKLTEIRQTFLDGAVPKDCFSCYKMDQVASSYKSVKSPQWLETARADTESKKVDALSVKFLDLRFNNTCNFTCRTCDSSNSSSWEKLNPFVDRPVTIPATAQMSEKTKSYNLQLSQSILDFSADLQEIYFAGGEPLIIREHYLLLENLIRIGRTNLTLSYNTNLSVLNGFGYDLDFLWSKFRNVEIYPSVDSLGLQGEYIREGFSSDNFKRNLSSIKKYVSGLQIVLSAYNIFSIQDLIVWAHQENLNFTIFPAYMPLEITVDCLPENILKQAANELSELLTANEFSRINQVQISNTIDYLLNAKYTEKKFKKFWTFNSGIDQYYKKQYRNIFIKEFKLLQDGGYLS